MSLSSRSVWRVFRKFSALLARIMLTFQSNPGRYLGYPLVNLDDWPLYRTVRANRVEGQSNQGTQIHVKKHISPIKSITLYNVFYLFIYFALLWLLVQWVFVVEWWPLYHWNLWSLSFHRTYSLCGWHDGEKSAVASMSACTFCVFCYGLI